MKKCYQLVIVGYGNRGGIYADYALAEPEQCRVAAVVDPNPFKREQARLRYDLTERETFETFAQFVASGIETDLVINATMDQHHYETAVEILTAGCDMLMEKPIVPEKEQLLHLQRLAQEKRCRVFVCHVLRYTPFYKSIKEVLNEGRIGRIMHLSLSEHVGISHFLVSYVRGKWNSEAACGSGFLLAKSCHDLDLMCWLNNDSAPVQVSSFGSRSQFIPENAPEGSAEYCHQCPREESCPYSASYEYLERDFMPFLTWDRLNKPLDEITREEKEEFLKTDIYGRCAYKCGGDIVDRQNVIVQFANGSIGTFDLVGGCHTADRHIHIVGTKGEIEGKLEKGEFVVKEYLRDWTGPTTTVKAEPRFHSPFAGHNGGDYAIMHDLLAYLDGSRDSVSITSLNDSINGHLCVFAAEESRRNGSVETI